MKVFSKKKALGFAWSRVKENLGLFTIIGITLFIFGLSTNYTLEHLIPREDFFLRAPFSLLVLYLSTVINIGYLDIVLKIHDGKEVKFWDLFKKHRLFFKYLLTTVIAGLASLAGLILLVIPGIIVSIKLQFAPFMVVDKHFGSKEALSGSWGMTKEVKWQLFLLAIILVGVNLLVLLSTNLLGLLAIGLGLIITYPLTLIAQVYVYRKLIKLI